MDIKIILEGFLSVITTEKPITINLYNENDLLLISFELAGFNALDDFLMDDEVIEINFPKNNTINIKIDTSKN